MKYPPDRRVFLFLGHRARFVLKVKPVFEPVQDPQVQRLPIHRRKSTSASFPASRPSISKAGYCPVRITMR